MVGVVEYVYIYIFCFFVCGQWLGCFYMFLQQTPLTTRSGRVSAMELLNLLKSVADQQDFEQQLQRPFSDRSSKFLKCSSHLSISFGQVSRVFGALRHIFPPVSCWSTCPRPPARQWHESVLHLQQLGENMAPWWQVSGVGSQHVSVSNSI